MTRDFKVRMLDRSARWRRSKTGKQKKWFERAPYPEKWAKGRGSRAWRLLATCQILRDELCRRKGRQVKFIILSGFRDRAYNVWIGGARWSRHMRGEAADLKVKGVPAHEVHDLALELSKAGKLPFLGGLGKYRGFTHVDVRYHSGRLARWGGARSSS